MYEELDPDNEYDVSDNSTIFIVLIIKTITKIMKLEKELTSKNLNMKHLNQGCGLSLFMTKRKGKERFWKREEVK